MGILSKMAAPYPVFQTATPTLLLFFQKELPDQKNLESDKPFPLGKVTVLIYAHTAHSKQPTGCCGRFWIEDLGSQARGPWSRR
jgi:hypothetical protein